MHAVPRYTLISPDGIVLALLSSIPLAKPLTVFSSNNRQFQKELQLAENRLQSCEGPWTEPLGERVEPTHMV